MCLLVNTEKRAAPFLPHQVHCWCLMAACCVQVKRKDPPDAAAAGDSKRARPSTPVDDELEDEGDSLSGLYTPTQFYIIKIGSS